MKILTLFAILLHFGICANEYNEQCSQNWRLEIRPAYYRPSCSIVRKVFSDGWFDWQIEGARKIHKYVEVWAGVSWARKQNGHVRSYDYLFDERTKMDLFPLSIGAKLIYPILPCTDVYVGVGLSYSILKISNHIKHHYSNSYYDSDSFLSTVFKHSTHASGAGVIFKSGLKISTDSQLFIDIFADYLLQNFNIAHHHAIFGRRVFRHGLNCSGWKIGIGVGVDF